MSTELLQNNFERTDEELLLLSVSHPSYFSHIVDRYQKLFLRKATKVLGNRADAEDVVQDTFIKIYKNAEKFQSRDEATFKSWGYAILINTCFSYLKKRKREMYFVEKLESEDLILLAGTQDEFESKLDLDRFVSIVQKIPSMLGRMLTLGVLEGKDYDDIAKLEGVSVGVVRTRVHRAKKEFKKAIS